MSRQGKKGISAFIITFLLVLLAGGSAMGIGFAVNESAREAERERQAAEAAEAQMAALEEARTEEEARAKTLQEAADKAAEAIEALKQLPPERPTGYAPPSVPPSNYGENIITDKSLALIGPKKYYDPLLVISNTDIREVHANDLKYVISPPDAEMDGRLRDIFYACKRVISEWLYNAEGIDREALSRKLASLDSVNIWIYDSASYYGGSPYDFVTALADKDRDGTFSIFFHKDIADPDITVYGVTAYCMIHEMLHILSFNEGDRDSCGFSTQLEFSTTGITLNEGATQLIAMLIYDSYMGDITPLNHTVEYAGFEEIAGLLYERYGTEFINRYLANDPTFMREDFEAYEPGAWDRLVAGMDALMFYMDGSSDRDAEAVYAEWRKYIELALG